MRGALGRNSVINHTEIWLRQRRKAPCDFYQALLVLCLYASVTGNAASQENGLGWQDQYSAWEGKKGLGKTSKSNSVIGVIGYDPLLPIRPRVDA